MADRYWVGGAGTWSTTATTNWSASSGGPNGASVPTSADNVFFDQAGTYSVTCTGALNCLDLTVSAGTVSFVNGTAPTFSIYGSFSLIAGTVWSSTGTKTFRATTTGNTITTNGVALAGGTTFSGSGGEWTLGSAFTMSGASILSINVGTFDTSSVGNYSITANQITSSGTSARTINFNNSTITYGTASSGSIFIFSGSGLTFNAGTSTITTAQNGAIVFSGSGATFYNVSFTSTSFAGVTFSGANTFNTLSFNGRSSTAPGVTSVLLSANQTINTLTVGASAIAAGRVFFKADTFSTTRTMTVGTFTSGATDIDFQDITVAGTAAPISGTRFGDCKGNSGITFPSAKSVYYRIVGGANWGGTGTGSWAFTDGGAVDATAFPLAQDTAIFQTYPTTNGSQITIQTGYNIGTIDMSLRTSNTMTLTTGSNAPVVYGNWVNGIGTTINGTGTVTFSGRGTQTITSAGKTFTQNFVINTPGGSVTLQDAFVTNRSIAGALTVTQGTFDAVTYNVTISAAGGTFSSTGTGIRTIAIGSGTWSIAGAGTAAWTTAVSTNLTVTGTGTISLTNVSGKTFAGGGVQTFPKLNQGGAGALTVSGSNKFADITNTAIGSVLFAAGSTNEFTNFNLNGSSTAARLTLASTTSVQAILKKPSTWFMGSGSLDVNNNTGLTFSAGGGIDFLAVSYINGQLTAPIVTYQGNFFAFF